MKRKIAIAMIVFLLLGFSAFAEKSFDDLCNEYDQLLVRISTCNEIISACEEYLAIKAETSLDTPELKTARSKLRLLDVIPYKKMAPEISYVKTALEIEQMNLELYQQEAKANLLHQGEYIAKLVKENDDLQKKKDILEEKIHALEAEAASTDSESGSD